MTDAPPPDVPEELRRRRRRPRRRWPWLVLLVAMVAGAGAAAVTALVTGDDGDGEAATTTAPPTAPTPTTTTAPPTTTTAPTTTLPEDALSVFDLEVGDCFDEPPSDTDLVFVPEVDCADPHDHEVFHVEELADGDFPGDDEVAEAARGACLEPFATFVGVPWIESMLDYRWLAPTEASWSEGDREVVCFVTDPAGPVIGTLAGVGR